MLALLSLRPGFEKVLVIALVGIEALGMEVDDISGDRVKEFPVVTHHQQRRLPRLKVVFQPQDGANLNNKMRSRNNDRWWDRMSF